MLKREMYNSSFTTFWGTMGEPTNHRGIFVGDVVAYKFKGNNDIVSGVVVKNRDGRYFVMGAVGIPIQDHDGMVRVIRYDLVTPEILNSRHGMKTKEVKIESYTPEEIVSMLGKEEIEKLLGKQINILR